MKGLLKLKLIVMLIFTYCFSYSQTPVSHNYINTVNNDYPHGQLPSVLGVHNIQIMRANRLNPDFSDGFGWTYNHAAMIAWWNNKLYVNYLSNRFGEHTAPGQTFLLVSADGYSWSFPVVLFPTYRIPDGTKKAGVEGEARNLDAVMHQRMGFYIGKKSNRLYALGFYGICITPKDKPNDGKGIGRVIREIRADGSLGDIFFIRYNHGWQESNTHYPFYKSSEDRDFVADCEELLSDPLTTLQWVEEADRNDPVIPVVKAKTQAFCYYRLPDNRIIGMWKDRLSGVSSDGGKTWQTGLTPGLFTSSAKMWGQQTSDGKYAQVFNPSRFRWPMAISLSENGLEYNNLFLVHGEVSPKRYAGNEKSYGPQYLTGLMPGNGIVPDKNMWLAYSVNKEDIWVMRVTVPVMNVETESVQEDFRKYSHISQLDRWNIYSPSWAPVSISNSPNGQNALKLADKDLYDYARAERLFPESGNFKVEFEIIPSQNNTGLFNIELQNNISKSAVRICFDQDGMIRAKRDYKYSDIIPYKEGEKYFVEMSVNCETRVCTIRINDKEIEQNFYAPLLSFSKIVFRTGETFKVPTIDTPADEKLDLPGAGQPGKEASYYLLSLRTKKLD